MLQTSSMRRTRQSTRQTEREDSTSMSASSIPVNTIGSYAIAEPLTTSLHTTPIQALPAVLSSKLTGLPKRDLALLHIKQRWLKTNKIQIPKGKKSANLNLSNAVDATLVFAQEEAGTAVCISPGGLLLTCSHCVAESAAEFAKVKSKWLLFASGKVVQGNCIAWDPKRDLALLQVVAAQPMLLSPSARTTEIAASDIILSANASSATLHASSSTLTFPSISLNTSLPQTNAPLACIGHPGAEDLEAATPGLKTNYDILHVSTGIFHGLNPDQDPEDNSEIGALMHDCWTYWGHSGAPLIERSTGGLVGLHSSWDDETGMRRGVPWEAVRAFLREHEELTGVTEV